MFPSEERGLPLEPRHRGLGLFSRFGASDGVANPIKYFCSVGVDGKWLILFRLLDEFGVGYAYATVSTARIPQRLSFRDGQAFEA